MNTTGRRLSAITVGFALVAALINFAPSAQAAQTLDFSVRYTTNTTGEIVIVGNNLLTCPASSSTCARAQGGESRDDNDYSMVNLDADNDPSTFNSSMSTLILPTGAEVLWAGLYWGARMSGTQAAIAEQIKQMSLKLPGESTYRTVAANMNADAAFGPMTNHQNAYQRMADVTQLVRAGGPGDYWGANVAADTGSDRYAGWSLVVAFSAPGYPLRNLTVFDGWDLVNASNHPTIIIEGFKTPLTGPVDTILGMVAYEGDRDQIRDFASLNDVRLSTTLSPIDNFFNSSNDLFGENVTTRYPAHHNMLGFDIKNLDVSGLIPNGATSAKFMFSSAGDVYHPGVLTTNISLYAPDFTVESTKTAVNLNGNTVASPGDIIEYKVYLKNTGQDAADEAVSIDQIPTNTEYVPGSLKILNGSGGATALTDAIDSDVGEFANNQVRVRLGTGANSTTGGQIGLNASAAYSFQVKLLPSAANTTITNTANLDYLSATIRAALTYETDPVSFDVISMADMAITKTMSPRLAPNGTPITITLTVKNNGPSLAADVEVRDPLPEGFELGGTDITGAPSGTTCLVATPSASPVLVCSLPDMPSASTAVIKATGMLPADTPASKQNLTNTATVTTSTSDPNLTNNQSSDTIQVEPQADLSITKTPAAPTVVPGQQVTYTLTVANNGPSNATGVSITDSVPASSASVLSLVSANSNSPGVTCNTPTASSLTCSVGSLAIGESRQVSVVAQLSATAATGSAFSNTATVSATTTDPNMANNTATSTGTVGAGSADLRLTKVSDLSTVVAGTPISYTLTASNWGPSDATGVVVSDTVPSTITIDSASSSQGTCSVVGQAITCSIGTLSAPVTAGSAGQSVTITIAGIVRSDAVGTSIVNTAEVTATTADPDPTNNSATATTALEQRADLSVVKSGSTSRITAAGDKVIYTITVSNAGPSVARSVALHDLVPQPLELDPDNPVTLPPGVVCDADLTPSVTQHQSWDCELGDIAVGGNVVIVVPTKARIDATAQMVETVTVNSAVNDPYLGNNTATWTLDEPAQADLWIVKSAITTGFSAGLMGTFRLEVGNNGPNNSTPLISDTLPTGLTFVPASTQGSQTSQQCQAVGQEVSCTRSSPLGVNQTWTVFITVLVSPSFDDGASVINTGRVEGSTTDPLLVNNSATISVPISASANMVLSSMKWQTYAGLDTAPGAAITSAAAGTFAWLSMEFTNTGPAVAKATSVMMAYDQSLVSILSGSAPIVIWNSGSAGGDTTCTASSGSIYCPLNNPGNGSTLAPGDTVKLTVLIGVPGSVSPGTTANAEADVATTTPESSLSDNHKDAPLSITPGLSHLSVTKATDYSNSPGAYFVAGQSFTYKVDIWQAARPGQDQMSGLYWADARQVTLSDQMPTGFHATAASSTQGSCSISPTDDSMVSCSIGTIPGTFLQPSNQKVTVTITGTIDPSINAAGVVNTANVSTNSPTDVAGPFSASATTDVVQLADLSLAIQVDTSASQTAGGLSVFYAGNEVGYTLNVQNAGPSTATGAVITNTLPVGLTLNLVKSPGCNVVAPGNLASGTAEVITCTLQTLQVGQSQSVRVVATTLPLDNRLSGTGPGCVPGAPSNPANPSSTPNSQNCDLYPEHPRIITDQAVVTLNGVRISDPNLANNPDSANAQLAMLVDLAANIGSDAPTIAAGRIVNYDFSITNYGPSTADYPFMDLAFPAGFVLQSWDVASYTCSESHSGNPVAYTLHCEPIPAAPWYQVLSPGTTISGTAVVRVSADVAPNTYTTSIYTNSATTDSNPVNNSATVTTNVQRVSDLSVAKTLNTALPMAGELVTYDVIATNAGPSVASSVVIQDAVPNGMTLVSALVGSTACSDPVQVGSQFVVECQIGALAVFGSATVSLTFRLNGDTGGSTLCNTAQVASSSIDPDLSNNQSEVCALIAPPPDVAIELSPTPASVLPSQQASYSAVISNNGPTNATEVQVVFDLPSGLDNPMATLVASTGQTNPSQTCQLSGSQLSCMIGALPADATVTYQVSGQVTGLAGTIYTLVGTTSQHELDTNADNNTAEASVLVVAPDIRVIKTVNPPDLVVIAGTTVEFTLTFSNVGTAPGSIDYANSLKSALDDADLIDFESSLDVEVVGELMNIAGTIADGQTFTVTYRMLVKADLERGDSVLFDAVFPADTPIDDWPSVATPQASCLLCSTIMIAGIGLEKAAEQPFVERAGDQVKYRYVVTNLGSVPIEELTFAEVEFSGTGPLLAVECPEPVLQPGMSLTCTLTYTVVETDMSISQILNRASVTGTVVSQIGVNVTSPESQAVTLVYPVIEVQTGGQVVQPVTWWSWLLNLLGV